MAKRLLLILFLASPCMGGTFIRFRTGEPTTFRAGEPMRMFAAAAPSSWTDDYSNYWVAVYHCEENLDGYITDGSPYTNHGLSVGLATFINGGGYEVATTEHFDGGTNVGNDIGVDGSNLTQAAWIRADAPAGANQGFVYIGSFASSHGAASISTHSGNVYMRLNNSAGSATAAWTNTLWSYVVGTYDGATIRLYVNGVEVDNTAYAATVDCSGMKGIVGSYHRTTVGFDGGIEHASINNYCVPSNVILAAYSTGRTNTTISTLSTNKQILYYGMTSNELAVLDSSGNGHDAYPRPTLAAGPTLYQNPQTNVNGRVNHEIDFDGSDDSLEIFDHADFTFASKPFSGWLWHTPDTNGANRVLVSKGTVSNWEWWFYVDAGAPTLTLYDNSAGTYIGRIDTNVLPFGVPVFLGWSYDGGTNSSGIDIIVNGTPTDNADNNSGVFVAMEDKGSSVKIGFRDLMSYADGLVDEVVIYSTNVPTAHFGAAYINTPPSNNIWDY